ncbi:hypothetical protein ACWCWD_03535 [Streptomyces sp. NPDC001493]
MRAVALAGLVPLVAVLGGCGEEREYAVPSSLCGIPVDSDLLEPLLPPGKEIEQRTSDAGQGLRVTCSVRIDGQIMFETEGAWWEGDFTALKAGAYHRGRGGLYEAEGGKIAYWDLGAVVVVPCKNARWKAGSYSVLVENVYRPGHKADVDGLRAFVKSYAKAVAPRLPCE